MSTVTDAQRVDLEAITRDLALAGFQSPDAPEFSRHPAWGRLRDLGTDPWLDTGDLDEARANWSGEMTHLTTNNTLVNKEVQKGIFDDAIREAARQLRSAAELSLEALVREVGFVVNCRAALRLVSAFGAKVSVELHPSMAHDVAASVAYGKRYHAVCPEYFLVKVPLTPGGMLACRQLSDAGVPVNFTLGFSARQNLMAAHIARPRYVNVFLGRLNSFVADYGLGDGRYVGEKAALATQRIVSAYRAEPGAADTRLIAASLRSSSQLRDLAGLDVMTIPTAAAGDFAAEYDPARPLQSALENDYPIRWAEGLDAEAAGLTAPWDIPAGLADWARSVGSEVAEDWVGEDLARRSREAGFNLFRAWTEAEISAIRAAGKIPNYARWREELASGALGLDDAFSVAALQSFAVDQQELDDRIRGLVA